MKDADYNKKDSNKVVDWIFAAFCVLIAFVLATTISDAFTLKAWQFFVLWLILTGIISFSVAVLVSVFT